MSFNPSVATSFSDAASVSDDESFGRRVATSLRDAASVSDDESFGRSVATSVSDPATFSLSVAISETTGADSLLCSDNHLPLTNFAFLMKKFGETELSSQLRNHETSPQPLLQDSNQNSVPTLPFNCEKMEETSKLQITEKLGGGGGVAEEFNTDGILFYDLKGSDYTLAPTPPGSDYEELTINAHSPGLNPNSLAPPDTLSPPLSIGSGLEFSNSPLLPPHYHPTQSPSSSSNLGSSPLPANGSPRQDFREHTLNIYKLYINYQ